MTEGVVNPPGGTRGDSLQHLFLVDGTSVTDESYNNVVLNPSPDDIEEFKIFKTNYSPEFGGKSHYGATNHRSAVTRVTLRSG